MIGEMTCPDCGGVVGALEATEAGPPCRCFADSSSGSGASGASVSGASVSGASMSGTLHAGSSALDGSDPDAAPPAPVTVVTKVCRVCGTDVAGHKRYRDSLGYLCSTCKKAEDLRENQGRVACRVCGKLVKPENLTDYEGTKMCPQCHEERRTVRLQEIKRMGFKGARTRDELRQFYLYLAVGGVLVFFILLGVVINHFRH